MDVKVLDFHTCCFVFHGTLTPIVARDRIVLLLSLLHLLLLLQQLVVLLVVELCVVIFAVIINATFVKGVIWVVVINDVFQSSFYG